MLDRIRSRFDTLVRRLPDERARRRPGDAIRIVAAAIDGVGREQVTAALPLLQPGTLSGVTKSALERGESDDALAALRVRAAAAVGTEPPELQELLRVNPRQLLMAVGALVAIAVLLSRVGNPAEFWDSIRNAEWAYVVLAFCLGMITDVAFAVAFLGTIPVRIPLWPSIELQSSMSFSNLAVPAAADAAIQIRFLQKFGLDLSSAVATGGIFSTVSEIVIQTTLFGIALWGVAATVVFSVRRIRRAVVPRIVRAASTVRNAMKSPTRVALLVGGNVAAHCLYAASLLACLRAFGSSVDFWTLLALNIGISLIASLVPFLSGGTAVSAVGMSGMLAAVGVPTAAATAAVIAQQLAVSYLPAIPGWFATNDLVRKKLL